MSDVYSAPDSELSNDQGPSAYGSIEKGLAGDFELRLGDLFKNAWAMTKGRKGTIWIAVILMIVALTVINVGTGFIFALLPIDPGLSAGLMQVVITLLSTPISVGLTLFGVKLVCEKDASATSIFNYFGQMFKLFALTVLMYVLVAIGFLLLVVPGIYLVVCYVFAGALMVEKDLGIWQALETSRKIVTKKWFTVFFTLLCIMLVVSLSAMALLVGLIWTIPLSVLITGLMYKAMFGVEQSTLESE
ncbi:hypothetical protein [Agaribacterium haliotis]|uniref:hypothetical protein n=1 Tax=Agaribacterium haliotis TaxID=2013869 RepID=UPI000BB544A7|nr:hypothetical protein [Agaribacterium haliotis]